MHVLPEMVSQKLNFQAQEEVRDKMQVATTCMRKHIYKDCADCRDALWPANGSVKLTRRRLRPKDARRFFIQMVSNRFLI